jgi:ribonuclease BN (tRNA processing enzyme)
VRVTVLGKSPSWPDAAGACSGYLVQEGDFTLLLDCGNGVFAKLRALVDYAAVDAVLISHLHADHFLDLVPYSYALTHGPRAPETAPALHVPRGGVDALRRVVGTWGGEDLIDGAFAITEYTGAEALTLGPLTARLCEVPHFILTHAVELTAMGRAPRFTFGADCRPNDVIVRFAADTDVLMLEATLTTPERDGPRGHLTPREAGELARAAGARRLVLTHFSDELDAEWVRAEAVGAFGGPVALAHEGAVHVV